MKFLVIGHGQVGKDELGSLWTENFGLKYSNSSEKACDLFMFDKLKGKYGYKTKVECFEDRRNHRQEWADLITEYNSKDKARLAKEILKDSDAYFGMRKMDELMECVRQRLFDLVIGITASNRVPEDPSMNINVHKFSDVLIDNNYSLELFKRKALRLGSAIF
jgi:hypothetical protein